MVITKIGMVIIPLSLIVLMFCKDKYLFYMLFISSAFTATSVINIESIQLAILAYHFIGGLFIIKMIIKKCNINLLFYSKSLFVFILICGVSLLYPIYISKGIVVLSPEGMYLPIHFSFQNVTQYMYLIFAYLIYLSTIKFIKINNMQISELIVIFRITLAIIVILGFIQYVSSVEIFNEWFRNEYHHTNQYIGNEIRISSACIEPSMLSVFIAPLTIVFLYEYKNNYKIKDLILIVLTFLISAFNNSSSYYIGIFTYFVFISLVKIKEIKYIKDEKISYKSILLTFSSLLFLIIILLIYNNKIDQGINATIKKLSGQGISGSERMYSFMYHIDIFKKYFLTGVGFGSLRTKDLISTWICEVGLLGFVPFIYYIVSRILFMFKKSKNNTNRMFGSLIVVLISILFISVPEPYYIYIWIWFAVIDIIYINNKKDVLKVKGIERGRVSE